MTQPAGGFVLVLVALSTFMGSTRVQGAERQTDFCLACHIRMGDERLSKPAREFRTDIHAKKGFGCVSCHGGDETQAGMESMDPDKGYIGKPTRNQIPQICGRCHSDARFMRRYNPSLRVDQLKEYYTSIHGQRLKQFGDPNVATCVSCHSAHEIKPPSDPRSKVHPLQVAQTCGSCHANKKTMSPYNIPTDQLVKYERSVHWETLSQRGDLSAPTCNDCHGNHGALPPGISWVGNVCGQCHLVEGELFSKSFHAQIFTQMGTPGCATCHQNHEIKKASDEMLGLGAGAVCANCHSREDKGGKTASQMGVLFASLKSSYEEAATLLSGAERAGMEVGQAQFELNGAQTALIKARAAVHAFRVEPVEKEIGEGLSISERAYLRGTRALEDLRFRRFGLTVSVVIILILVMGLVIKIRQLERKKPGASDG